MRYHTNELLALRASDDHKPEDIYRSTLGKLTRPLYVYRELLPDIPLLGAILDSVEGLYHEEAVQRAIGGLGLSGKFEDTCRRRRIIINHANIDALKAISAEIGKLPPAPGDEDLIPIGTTADVVQVVEVMKEQSRQLTYIALIARTVTATATGMQGRPLFHRSYLGEPDIDATTSLLDKADAEGKVIFALEGSAYTSSGLRYINKLGTEGLARIRSGATQSLTEATAEKRPVAPYSTIVIGVMPRVDDALSNPAFAPRSASTLMPNVDNL